MSAPTLVDELTVNDDPRDVNTVAGLLNRLAEVIDKNDKHDNNLAFYPVVDDVSFQFYKLQEVAVWNTNEMDFSRDKTDYEMLSPSETRIVDEVIAFFTQTDSKIIKNISYRLSLEASSIHELAFYQVQNFIEGVHTDTYALMINTMVTDPVKRLSLFQAADNYPHIRNKNIWMDKYFQSNLPREYIRAAMACVEGIFFSTSFMFVFWFRSRGKLPNFIFSNEQIAKDERLHRDFAIAKYVENGGIPTEHINRIVREAVELECEFVDAVIPEPVEDLNADVVKNFVRFIGDHLLTGMGHDKIFNADKPPEFMLGISKLQKGNFYEVEIGNYKQGSKTMALDWEGRINGDYADQSGYVDPDSIMF